MTQETARETVGVYSNPAWRSGDVFLEERELQPRPDPIMSLTAVGKNFTRMFDQYSVICVFGSVVGCVVMPWITQVKDDDMAELVTLVDQPSENC